MRNERREERRVFRVERRFDEEQRLFRGDANGRGFEIFVLEVRPGGDHGARALRRWIKAAQRDDCVQTNAWIGIIQIGQHGLPLRRIVFIVPFAR